MAASMLITVEDLARGPVRLDRNYARGEIEARDPGLEAIGPIEAHAEARLAGPEVRIHLRFSGQVELVCARCLAPVVQPVAEDANLVYHPASELAPVQEMEIHAADSEVGFFARGIEMEELLRERVLLALPMRTLCREECPGLCPRCGQNLNEGPCACPDRAPDARWQPLAEYRARH